MVKTWEKHKTTETILCNGWKLAVGGGWRLVVGGWWRLAVGPWGLSLRVVLEKKMKDGPDNLSVDRRPPPTRQTGPLPVRRVVHQRANESSEPRTAVALPSTAIGNGGRPEGAAPCVTFCLVVAPLRGLDSHPLFPSHVASGCCFLSAAAASALAGVVFCFAEPSNWCVGAVLNVAWCAGCASAAPNNWRIEDVLVVAGVV